MTGSTIFTNFGRDGNVKISSLNDHWINQWITEVFVEPPLASPGSANYLGGRGQEALAAFSYLERESRSGHLCLAGCRCGFKFYIQLPWFQKVRIVFLLPFHLTAILTYILYTYNVCLFVRCHGPSMYRSCTLYSQFIILPYCALFDPETNLFIYQDGGV